MRILEKYVLKHFIYAFLFCTVLLMILGVIGDILGFLDDIVKNNIPLPSILSFYFYLLPFAFVNMISFSGLLSAAFVFNTFSKNHEVTAVVSNGLSLWSLLRPVLFVTFVLCLAVFIINDRFVPASMREANRIRHEELEQDGRKKDVKIKNLAIYGKGNQIIFAKSYNPRTHVLENVIIHKQNEEHVITEKVSARRLKWLGGGIWQGFDVIIFRVRSDGAFSREPEVYKAKKVHVKETPEDFTSNQWDPRFMSYGQLKKYLKVFSIGSPATIRRLQVELHYKVAFPFTVLITILVGVPFSIETGRASPLIGMVRGVAIAMLYLPIMGISLALGKGGILPPVVAAWLSNILFAIAGAYFVNKKS